MATSYLSYDQVSTPGFKGQFNYVAPTPVAPKFDIGSVKDVPTLNTALKSGQISSQQWMQRFKQIQPTTKGFNAPQSPTSKINTSLGNNLNPFAKSSALGGALNQVFIQSPKAAVVDTKNAVANQVKTLTAPTASADQRASIISNQKTAQTNPEFVKATQGLNLANNSASGKIQAQSMAAKGAKASQIKQFLQKDAQVMSATQGKALNVLGNVASIDAGGLAGKLGAAKSGIQAVVGKDEATNALINSQKVANATKASRLADVLGSSSVKEANTTHIPIISPNETTTARQAVGSTALKNADRTSIPVTGKSTQVAGKVTTISDAKYIAASNKLSDQYEKELAQIKTVPSPVYQQVKQKNLDAKYNALQERLDNTSGRSSISFKGKPITVLDTTTLPRSALDKNPVTPFNSTRIPVESPALPKPRAETPVTKRDIVPSTQQGSGGAKSEQNLNITPGNKVSGSALKSEQRAVETGLIKEFPDKATYTGTSYTQDAEDAVKLANENPDKAKAIASGRESGPSQAYNVAVRRAVENKAQKENDIDTIMQLGNSSAHTKTSEAAQTLGAEAYNAHANSPVEAIKQVAAIRKQTATKQLKESPAKAISNTVKEIKSQPALKVSRQDWHSFVSDLRCK